MAKTIKVIDLLNKIANGEDVPERVKYCGTQYLYLDHRKDYKNMELDFDSCIIDSKYHNLDWLNDTVEIIEEQQDIDIQEIKEFEIKGGNGEIEYFEYDNHGATESGYSKNYSLDDIECRKVINKLVQAVKQLDRNIKDKE